MLNVTASERSRSLQQATLLPETLSLLFPAVISFRSPATSHLNPAAEGLAVALATEHLQMGIQASLESQTAQGEQSLARTHSQVLDSVLRGLLGSACDKLSGAPPGGFCYCPFRSEVYSA